MQGHSVATLLLAIASAISGFIGLPWRWAVVNLAIVATLAGMAMARHKFSGIPLSRTLLITLAAFVANCLVSAAGFFAGGLAASAYVALRFPGAGG